MIRADLATITGERQNIERARELAERGAGHDKRGVPVQNATLLNTWRQGRISEIDPVHTTKLYWVTKRSLVWTENGVWHP
jgi:hypothetical protein